MLCVLWVVVIGIPCHYASALKREDKTHPQVVKFTNLFLLKYTGWNYKQQMFQFIGFRISVFLTDNQYGCKPLLNNRELRDGAVVHESNHVRLLLARGKSYKLFS